MEEGRSSKDCPPPSSMRSATVVRGHDHDPRSRAVRAPRRGRIPHGLARRSWTGHPTSPTNMAALYESLGLSLATSQQAKGAGGSGPQRCAYDSCRRTDTNHKHTGSRARRNCARSLTVRILEAYNLTGSLRAAAALARVSHGTVIRYVGLRDGTRICMAPPETSSILPPGPREAAGACSGPRRRRSTQRRSWSGPSRSGGRR